MTDECALFLIDGPNFYKNLKSGSLQRKHLDYMRLASNFAQGRTIVDVVLFTSPVDRATDAGNYVNQQRFFAAFQRAGGTLKLGRLVSRRRECEQCGGHRGLQNREVSGRAAGHGHRSAGTRIRCSLSLLL